MDEFQKLIKHLENLHKAGHKEFNINVEWLLSVLKQTKRPIEVVQKQIDLDGGKF